MLTAVVKPFLYKDSSQGLVQRVLTVTPQRRTDSPDVRDRAYIYWRLLSTDSGAAKVWGPNFMTLSGFLFMRFSAACHSCTSSANILTSHHCCARATQRVDWEISSLASVYQKPAATFIGLGRIGVESM